MIMIFPPGAFDSACALHNVRMTQIMMMMMMMMSERMFTSISSSLQYIHSPNEKAHSILKSLCENKSITEIDDKYQNITFLLAFNGKE